MSQHSPDNTPDNSPVPPRDSRKIAASGASRPVPDELFEKIADYVLEETEFPQETLENARLCLLDALGCAVHALNYTSCTRLLGPWVEGTKVPGGVHVPGTPYFLDPVKAAFDIGTLVRWLDFNDTWLAAEWGHPSDNLGAILSLGYYISKTNLKAGDSPLKMIDILKAMIKAYEIQGRLALENAFNRVGLDHVILVKLASVAVATRMLGGERRHIINALSQAIVDGHPLRTYRHAPNTGPRKSWAAGDACARAVQLSLMTMRGEAGYPAAISTPRWGLSDVLLGGKSIIVPEEFTHYVIDNILFKISYPAEFHAQTAVEAAIRLHPQIKNKISAIKTVHVKTHEAAVRIIDKHGPLHNPADRDHCLQYMVAVALLEGDLTAAHYEDDYAATHPNIDQLREKFSVREEPAYTQDYYAPGKRAIANALMIEFSDGSKSEEVEIFYPLGHSRRRDEGLPILQEKLERNLRTIYGSTETSDIIKASKHLNGLIDKSVIEFVDMFEAHSNI